MGKSTGFMESPRVNYSYRAVEERVTDYKEMFVLPATAELQRQGSRCMDCGVPFCHGMGCPLCNLIPEWNDLVYRGQWREAYDRLALTNNLPEITGRICPAPCEASCTLSINTAPVTIKQIELAIIERAFAEGWVVPQPPAFETGKRIAIIGSGPAGLAAAQQLRRKGHAVTVFEKGDKIGGILRYGIPDFKLEKHILDRRLDLMRAEGIRFESNTIIGDDIAGRYLRRNYDAIVVTMGAGQPRDLHVPGRGLENIHYAMEYLILSNRRIAGEVAEQEIISARNKNVLVIGGGDTGADCVGTAIRQGAQRVCQYEIMPKPVDWQNDFNPDWPYWPQILRTSTSHEEGCERDWAITTKQFTSSGIAVQEAHLARVEWQPDASGRMQMKERAGSEFVLKVDLVLLAMGFLHVEHHKLFDDLGVEFDSRGFIKTQKQYTTSVPGVFVAGDAETGASLVVRAIDHGRKAAEAIDEYLKG